MVSGTKVGQVISTSSDLSLELGLGGFGLDEFLEKEDQEHSELEEVISNRQKSKKSIKKQEKIGRTGKLEGE